MNMQKYSDQSGMYYYMHVDAHMLENLLQQILNEDIVVYNIHLPVENRSTTTNM